MPEFSAPKILKMCDTILVTLIKCSPIIVNPENPTPSSGTYPLEPTTRKYPPPLPGQYKISPHSCRHNQDYKI